MAESVGNVGVVAFATLGAGMYGITAVLTVGSNYGLGVGVTESRKDLTILVITRRAADRLETGSAAGGLNNIFNVGVSERRNYVLLLRVSAVVSAGERNESFARTSGINYGLDYIVLAKLTVGEGI